MKYVIIGNSAAAIGCIEGIRRMDSSSPITLISKEPYHTYSRPLISYLLAGKANSERMKYRSDDFYKKNYVTPILGESVISVKSKENFVICSEGDQIFYDKLLFAVGSHPFIPLIDGLDTVKNKTTFFSLDDAEKLSNMITNDTRVLILGAGLIGLKCAEGIRDQVAKITVVDLSEHILPRILDTYGSMLVQKHLEENGIQFYLNSNVQRFMENMAVLKDGTNLPFDVLVVAVGIRPNTELAQNAGIKVYHAIGVNNKSETNLTGIYAAGDCTECLNLTSGKKENLAILPNAYLQGETAGINMAGGNKKYNGSFPMNAIGFFGLHMMTAGNYDGKEYIRNDGHFYKKLITQNNKLRGFIMIGNVEQAGIYTSLIREETPLTSIDFDLILEKPQLMAFSHTERVKRLGGITHAN